MASTLSSGLLRRVFGNFAWAAAGETAARAVAFLANALVAQTLGAAAYGAFSLGTAVTIDLWPAADLGVNMYGSREVARRRDDVAAIVNPLFATRVLGGVVVYAGLALAVCLLDRSRVQALFFLACGAYLPARALYLDWALRGLEKFRLTALGTLAAALVFLALVFFFVRGPGDALHAALFWAGSYLVGATVFYFLYTAHLGYALRPVFSIRIFRAHLSESLHFCVSGTLATLNQFLPILLLGATARPHDVGLFAAPHTLVVGVILLITMLPMSLYPVFVDLYWGDRPRFRALHRRYALLLLPFGVGALAVGFFFAGPIVHLIYGADFAGSAELLQISVLCVFLYCLRSPAGIGLATAGLQRFQTVSTATGSVLTVTAFFALRGFGCAATHSAAWAMAVAEAGVTLLLNVIWRMHLERSDQSC